ncbi:MAG: hypothetical protein IPP97_14025 [Candidatus Obscuribacter sp.]|nr:hypothetical protein [Candidatus Obscuribacter sp.]
MHQVPVTALDIIEHLSDACYFSEGLAVNGHLSAKHMLNKAIHNEGFRVSLTGEGSDEVLAGYPHLRQDLLSLAGDTNKLRDLHAANPMSKGIMLATGQSLDLQVLQQRLGYIPAFLQAKAHWAIRCSLWQMLILSSRLEATMLMETCLTALT